MIPAIRKAYNEAFTQTKYEAFLKELHGVYPDQLDFRVAETPIFVPKGFTQQMLDACESIIDIIVDPNFKTLTKNAVTANVKVPGEDAHTQFIAFDFGICINEAGEYEPQLVEMQGFPSLFAYEILVDEIFLRHFEVFIDFSFFLCTFLRVCYIQITFFDFF